VNLPLPPSASAPAARRGAPRTHVVTCGTTARRARRGARGDAVPALVGPDPRPQAPESGGMWKAEKGGEKKGQREKAGSIDFPKKGWCPYRPPWISVLQRRRQREQTRRPMEARHLFGLPRRPLFCPAAKKPAHFPRRGRLAPWRPCLLLPFRSEMRASPCTVVIGSWCPSPLTTTIGAWV
jgi:hypothetical protein